MVIEKSNEALLPLYFKVWPQPCTSRISVDDVSQLLALICCCEEVGKGPRKFLRKLCSKSYRSETTRWQSVLALSAVVGNPYFASLSVLKLCQAYLPEKSTLCAWSFDTQCFKLISKSLL